MLTELHIENIAVIRRAGIRFAAGLNVFTGETGAGKTILISAIDAVLGERTSKEIIRAGEDKATVTAMFEDISSRALEALEALGYEAEEGCLLISREIYASGKSACKIGGVPATAAMLRELAPLLLNIHGQRDGARLLAGEHHLHLIDAFGGLAPEIAAYRECYNRMRELEAERESLEMDEAEKARRVDMLTFQIEEIEGAALEDPEEEETLTAQRKRIQGAETIREALSHAYGALQGGEELLGIDGLMDGLLEGVSQAAAFMPELEAMAGRIEEIGYELEEYARELRHTLDNFEFDPGELNGIESRLDVIYKLKRKYGGSIEEILGFLESARLEREQIATAEERAGALAAELEAVRKTATKQAAALSERRRELAGDFVELVEGELAFLDMGGVKLSVEQRVCAMNPRGMDEAEFYIVTNVGEAPKPLSKIASGGEVARIMLAIKNVLAEKDDVATLIFDEVDTGVSGRAARKIGAKLKQVARARQVICVTHLAQVAAFADSHLLIRKDVEEGRTYTRIYPLEGEDVVRELARITSGDDVTPAALESARELWSLSRN